MSKTGYCIGSDNKFDPATKHLAKPFKKQLASLRGDNISRAEASIEPFQHAALGMNEVQQLTVI